MKTGSALRLQAAWVLYFDEVARCLSIREAARRLNVSPSAISRQIREIEETVGAKLLERIGNRMRLTAAGESVAFHAASMLANLERMQVSMDEMRGLKRGHVNIVAIQATSTGLLPSIVSAFSRDHARITFDCRFTGSADVVASVIAGDADIGISFSSAPNASLRHLIAVPLPFGAIVHPAHPLASRTSIAVADLVGAPLILPDQSISTRATVDELFQNSHVAVKPLIESSSPEFIVSAVRMGIGIAFQTPVGIERELRDDELRFLPLVSKKLRPPQLVVSMSSSRPPSPIAAIVAEAARQAVAQLLPPPPPPVFSVRQQGVKEKVD